MTAPRSVTFVHHPVVDYGQNYGARFAPLWAFTLSSYVPESFEPRLLDGAFQAIEGAAFSDVFAFSGINQDLGALLADVLCLRALHPRALFVLGGPITWSFEQEGKLELLAAFDYLFLLDGEETFPRFLSAVEAGSAASLPRILRAERFELSRAKSIDFELYARSKTPGAYYGATIEVSRGCPFLCEFCDIRSIPGNNRANNKSVVTIVAEMERYLALGISQFVFVCDNFIGDVRWATECTAALIELKQRTLAQPSIFTWLTVNLAKHGALMGQLRRAGFSVLYIGLESVNQSSLLETAKVQNRVDLEAAVQLIHEHGFVVAPGLIFGFDSDSGDTFDETLKFIERAGLIGGDPSFLMALPGTPLYERMRRTGRLVEPGAGGTERRKISTNIRYLQGASALAQGFTQFMADLNGAAYQLARFRRHLELITSSDRYVDSGGAGFSSPGQYLKLQLLSPLGRAMAARRLWFFFSRPANALAALRGLILWKRAERTRSGLGIHFYFWIYFWSNLALKYQDLKPEDFDLHSAPPDLGVAEVALDAAQALLRLSDLSRPRSKDYKQAARTSAALAQLAARRSSTFGDEARTTKA